MEFGLYPVDSNVILAVSRRARRETVEHGVLGVVVTVRVVLVVVMTISLRTTCSQSADHSID